MFIEKLMIFDYKNEEANSFSFSSGSNIVCSKNNTSGKSCLLKSIYYALGLELKKFPEKWNYKEMIFKIFYEHEGKRGFVLRYGDNFLVNDHNGSMSSKEYAKWLLSLLDIKIKLPLKANQEMHDVYASVPLSLFYIDQDTSWSGALYKNTVNLQYYASIPKGIFEYLLGISNDEIIKLEDDKTKLNNQNTILSKQCDVLVDLKDKFTLDVPSVTFDEAKAKNEISQYLKLANELGQKIKKYKTSLYSKHIELDALLLDKQELDEILKYLKTSFENIEHTCTQCNSHLTVEQSIQRMRLDNNQASIQIYALDLEKKIKILREEIKKEEERRLNLEDDYTKLLSIAETRQGDLTLSQHIEDRAKENTKNIYCDIRNNLSDTVLLNAQKVRKITKEIRELKKAAEARREEIKKSFEVLLIDSKVKFPKANLDGYEFLEFKEIKDSGSVRNEVFLCLYMLYSSILSAYSNVKLPFVLDTFFNDEVDSVNIKKFCELVEKTFIASSSQTFCAMLEDKLQYIKSPYNKITLEDSIKLLNKEKFDELKPEFSNVFDSQIFS